MDAVASYAIAERCRGELLGEYFGIPIEEECGICDVCRRAPGRPVSFFAMRGVSAHSNGFQTCRTLHLIQMLLGALDEIRRCPGVHR